MTDIRKYDRTIEVLCPTCGNSQFETDAAIDAMRLTCLACGLQIGRDELRDANEQNIAAHAEEIKHEILSDIRRTLQSSFKSNKSFRLKS